MLALKPTVSLKGLKPQTLAGAMVVYSTYANLGYIPCTITSGNDSVHEGKPVAGETKDPHYTGRALDFRIKHVPAERREGLVTLIQEHLTADFRLLWESRGTENEHIHLQYEGA